MNKFTVSSLLILLSAVVAVPAAIAQMEDPNETRIEKYEDLTETEADTTSQTDMEGMEMEYEDDGISQPETRTEETLQEVQSSDFDYSSYDVRRTEAFNLVSSAYRGDFEDQGINGYATLITNYETGDVTAEDIVNAAIESGELSPMALEDSSYVEAVDSQLNVLTES